MSGTKQANPSAPRSKPPQPPTLHWPEGAKDWNAVVADKVLRVIIGRLEGKGEEASKKTSGGEQPTVQPGLPGGLADRFTNLTHLYLWNLDWLTHLPKLPASLQCLDVRGCSNLKSLTNLPPGLDTLVLDRCPALRVTKEQIPSRFDKLDDLSLREAHGLDQAWFDELLRRCPRLRKLDASGCQWLNRIAFLPRELVDLRLRGCKKLQGLPASFPADLRRLDLNGAEAIARLSAIGDKLDYVDLSGAAALTALPVSESTPPKTWPSTLILHQSGVRVPPASEHGEAGQNVSQRVREHLRLRSLTGVGAVRRCKILLVGNGSAGKTCLSLRLVPGHDVQTECKKRGTTHGVQFFPWHSQALIADVAHPVQLHLWDFGGQEIYHNTHRIFMSTGSVFLVLWNPAQDGKQPPPGALGHQDRWRSLRYWLDLIKLERPRGARIAVVCSYEDVDAPVDRKHPKGSHGRLLCSLEEARRYRADFEHQLRGDERDAIGFFCVDSWNAMGELTALTEWLEKEVGAEIVTAGQEVPACWEPAQDMVEAWLEQMERDKTFAEKRQVMGFADFQGELKTAITEAISVSADPERTTTDYTKLAEAVRSGTFKVDDETTKGVLRFLTRSGWLFWDERLIDQQVIVGQKWALDGIYAILDRNLYSPIHQEVSRKGGVFTLSGLRAIEGFTWNGRYGPKEQELLLSFMERCGLCFKLRDRSRAWANEHVFVSVEHLPSGEDIRRQFDAAMGEAPSHVERIRSGSLHRLHWQRMLSEVGRDYGRSAEYAQDAISLENVEGQAVLIAAEFEDRGFGGEVTVTVTVAGRDDAATVTGAGREDAAKTRLHQIVEWLRGVVPTEVDARAVRGGREALGGGVEVVTVFFSYTWNKPEQPGGPSTPSPYEEPVDKIQAMLDQENEHARGAPARGGVRYRFDYCRDKKDVDFGDSIRQFMEKAGTCDKVIVVHSDKFCQSPYCMYELHMLHNGPRKVPRSIERWIIPVEHRYAESLQRLAVREGAEHWAKHWRKHSSGTPYCWPSAQDLCDHAPSAIRWFGELVGDVKGPNIRWDTDPEEACREVLARLKTSDSAVASQDVDLRGRKR